VEGLCFTYRRNLYRNIRHVDAAKQKKCILPCTPLACVKILEHLAVYDSALPVGSRLEGKVVTIINRSEIVGRPLAAMLANDGATIYSVDIDSIYLFQRGKLVVVDETAESAIRRSQVIICGVPTKDYKLTTEWVQPGTAVVNVSTFKNVHEEELLAIPGVQYVPMVGKVTVAMLERNLLRLHSNFAIKQEAEAEAA
jgi:methylenetetrahydrofolate dehydrogenase (NAD+)